ncbi:MAG TPA: type II secretion system major pseudopilin GspG [Tepidisphaeraceae bacterium]|jgi:general secretion pathway protein G|nr:type II secretion system major pseudopilin GspG [Tepidisphaeraceae bacterium]
MNHSTARQNRKSGFTLVELMLVMLILAILAAVVVPRIAGRGEDAKKAAAKADITNISSALDSFEVECGRYPTSDEGLQALVMQPGNVPQGSWKGPYVKLVPKDPWGNPYVYVAPGQHSKDYDLYTTQGAKDSTGNEINNWGGASGTAAN